MSQSQIDLLNAAIRTALESRDVLQERVDAAEAEYSIAVADAAIAGQPAPKRPQSLVTLRASIEATETAIDELRKRLAQAERDLYAQRQAALVEEVAAILEKCQNGAVLGMALVELGSAIVQHVTERRICGLNYDRPTREALTRSLERGDPGIFGGEHHQRIAGAFAEARSLGRSLESVELCPSASIGLDDSPALVPRLVSVLGPTLAEAGLAVRAPEPGANLVAAE